MKSWIFLGIAILGEVVATSALKDIPVGIAYAVWAGLGIVLVAGIAWALYGQKLDAWALVGIGMILGGVLVLNLLSKSSTH